MLNNITDTTNIVGATELLKRHPDLADLLLEFPDHNVYKILDENDRIIEYWEKKDGVWVDVTKREKLKEKIAEEKALIKKLKREMKENATESK